MNAYDEGSDARRGPDEPGAPANPESGSIPVTTADGLPAPTPSPRPVSRPDGLAGAPHSSSEPERAVSAPHSSSEPERAASAPPQPLSGPEDAASASEPSSGPEEPAPRPRYEPDRLAGAPHSSSEPDRAAAPALQPPYGPDRAAAPAPQPPYEPDRATAPAPQPPYDGGVPVPPAEPRSGVAALSLRYQVGAALALAVVAIGVCVHLGMTFLHLAPANTLTKEHGKAIEEWIYPEFEQNWKLFAPNPLQQNIAVQVRAQVRTADGETRTTGWYDLSAEDGRAIDGNPLPSHTQQNELRRAWDFFVATHDGDNRPVGLRGALSETYLRRIVVLRLDRENAAQAAAGRGGVVERVQIRSRTSNVPPPEWSREKVSDTPAYRLLPWWSVPDAEARGGAR